MPQTATNHATGERFVLNEETNQWETYQPVSGEDIMRGGLSGALLGFGDEARAGVYGLLSKLGGDDFSQNYRAYRDAERAELDRFRRQHPGAAIASELGGGLMTGFAGGAGTARAAAAPLARLAAKPFATRAAAATGAGAAGGAVAGAGNAPELADVPGEMALGALIGAPLGAVPVVASAARATKQAATPLRASERQLRRALKRDELTPQQAVAKLRKMGPRAMLADVGENLRTELEGLVQRPGKVRAQAIKQLTKRSSETFDEILNATGRGNYWEVLDGVRDIRSRVGSRLYRRAFDLGVEHNDELETIFKAVKKDIPGAWRDAQKMGRLKLVGEGEDIAAKLAGPDGRPSLEGWQSIKERIDDLIGAATRKGEGKRASTYMKVQRRLLDELDGQNPLYAAAREMWAGSKAFEEALDNGKRFLQRNLSATDFSREFGKLDDINRLAYREGARQTIQDALEKLGETHDLTKIFRTRQVKAKLRTLFGPRESAKILRAIDSSHKMQQTMNQALGNSATARRLATKEEQDQIKELLGAAADMALTGNPQMVGAGMLRQMARKIPTSREATRNLSGDALLSQGPEAIQLLEQLARGGQPLPPIRGPGLLAPAALGAGGGLLATR